MSVLIEGVSVVLRNSTIGRKYKGGFPNFKKDFLDGTFCTDDRIVRVGFMAPPDVRRFVMNLEEMGFVFKQNDKCVDIVVVDQKQGFTIPCDWLAFQYTPDGIAFCYIKGFEADKIAVPSGWSFENSLSKKFSRSDSKKDFESRYKFLRTNDGIDVYLDTQTMKEVYMGRK